MDRLDSFESFAQISGGCVGQEACHIQLENDGWRVLRFWNDDGLKDIDGVCAHILKILRKDHL
jgi:hypothetical protein